MAAPSQAVLDAFDRANGGLGTAWTQGLYQGTQALQILSNQVRASTTDYCEANWNATTYTNSEAYVTIATLPAENDIVYLWCRGQNLAASGADGYQLVYTRLSGTDTLTVHRVIDQVESQIGTTNQEIAAGDAIGLVVLGTGATVTIQIWHRPSGGSWTQRGSDISDTNAARITAAGRLGLGTTSTAVRLDDFGGGEQTVTTIASGAGVAASLATPLAASLALVSRAAAAHGLSTALGGSTSISQVAGDAVAGGLSAAPAVGAMVRPAAGNLPLQRRSIRFFGSTVADVDRVRIPLTTSGGTVATAANIGAGDWTVEFWIRCRYADNASTATTDWRYSNVIYDRDIWGDSRGHGLGLARSGANLIVVFGIANTSLDHLPITGSTHVGDDAYHHVAIDRNGSTGLVRIFVDGNLEGSRTYQTSSLAYPTSYTPTGGQDNEYIVLAQEKHDLELGYTGYLAELRLSTTRRYTGTAFTRPAAPFDPDASTAALYHTDSLSGTTLLDSSTVSGAPTHGELLRGGTNNGPQWAAESPFPILAGSGAATGPQAGGSAVPGRAGVAGSLAAAMAGRALLASGAGQGQGQATAGGLLAATSQGAGQGQGRSISQGSSSATASATGDGATAAGATAAAPATALAHGAGASQGVAVAAAGRSLLHSGTGQSGGTSAAHAGMAVLAAAAAQLAAAARVAAAGGVLAAQLGHAQGSSTALGGGDSSGAGAGVGLALAGSLAQAAGSVAAGAAGAAFGHAAAAATGAATGGGAGAGSAAGGSRAAAGGSSLAAGTGQAASFILAVAVAPGGQPTLVALRRLTLGARSFLLTPPEAAMASSTQFLEGAIEQRPLERIAYRLDTTRFGGSPTAVAVTLHQLATPDSVGTDVSATHLSGASAVAGNVITTPHLQSIAGGQLYRLAVTFTCAGNDLSLFVYVHGRF